MSTSRRPTIRRRPAPKRTSTLARRRVRRSTRPALTPEQWRDLGGVLLAGLGLLGLLAMVVQAPLLAVLRSLVLWAVGLGWPLLLGGAIATGTLMVWPTPARTRGPQTHGDHDQGDGEVEETARRPFQPRPPSWLEVAVGLVALLAVLGILSLASAPAGGAAGRLSLWAVSPAGSVGGLLILLLVLVLAGIVTARLSPGRAGLAAVSAGRSAITARGRVRGLLEGPRALLDRVASLRPGAVEAPAVVPATAAEGGQSPGPAEASPPAPASATSAPLAGGGDSAGIAEARAAAADDGEGDPDAEQGGADAELGDIDRDDSAGQARPPTGWRLPELTLLAPASAVSRKRPPDTKAVSRLIENTLADFGVEAKVVGVSDGPAITQYALQPAAGVAVRRVVALQNDLALALAASSLRIEAPIPGRSAIGIEVPNRASTLVPIREVVESAAFGRGQVLAVALGKDVAGRPVAGDLTLMPHLLIAGATGQGKSVCINSLVCSLLLQLDPDRLWLLMVDPKRVELQGYNGLPHLAVPVIVEPQLAAAALRWAVGEMERRYKVLAAAGVRNIAVYNARAAAAGEGPLPYVVIVIDELADLMMVAAAEVEELICRIAQLARAVGIHLVIATQRPSREVITGLIKANIPSRIAFAVGSQVDSRVILDSVGAEKLLGRGDMLYQPVSASRPDRLQGAFIADREVEDLVGFWRAQGEPRHLEGVLDAAPIRPAAEAGEERELDPLFARAARAVAAEGAASVSLVQRKLNVGYSRAGRLVDQLAEHRVIGPYQGSKSREVLMGLPEVDELLERLGVEG